ncbi:MAG: alcohol dehydrogenase catalytic domain-containing protein [Candidatus Hydrogenedentes bacterium]|nr:alcohol dehydrogenase catalytic domain-containing protein [Candidatus Hydrogenedentota bacterium]
MRAMRLTALRDMKMFDVPDPQIAQPDELLIRMTRVGVCGSDVHYYTTGRIGVQVVQYPFTVGHECAGVVEAVGSGVTHFKPGDRIAIDPAMPCGACDQCQGGRPHTCRKLRFLGCPGQAEGSLSEYIVMPEGSCFPLKDVSSFELGVLSEPLAIGVYACQLAGELKGKKIGILGCGPIGLSVLMPARHAGAGAVYMTDKIDARLQIAQGCGADWIGNPDTQDVVAQISAAEPLLLDYVFECCGQQDAVDNAIEILAPGGKLVMIGIPEVDRISFQIDKMRRKEICFQNVRRQNECTHKTIDLLESGALNAERMVTHYFPFEDTKAAFDLVAAYQDGVVKAMITFD